MTTMDPTRPSARSDAASASAAVIARCFWCERSHSARRPLSVCADCAASLRTMRSLEMSGSFPLNDAVIDEELLRKSPGNYALGYLDGGSFVVFYVGRSDSDLRQRLHDWVDMPSRYERYASPARAPWCLRSGGALPMGVPVAARVENGESRYTHFAYSYASSADHAYAKEWRNYDGFGGAFGLDNEHEPSSPSGAGSATGFAA